MILQQDMSYHKHWFLDSENSLVFQSWWAFYQECFLSFLKMVIWKREISIKPIAQSLIHETQDRIRLIWIVHIPSGYSGAVFTPKLSSWCHLLFLLTICLKIGIARLYISKFYEMENTSTCFLKAGNYFFAFFMWLLFHMPILHCQLFVL